MNALTTSLEEVGKPIEIDSVSRILKSQYDKKKSLSTNQEEQGFMDQHQKRCLYALIASKKGILSRIAGLKTVKKKAKVRNKREDPGLGRKKEKKGIQLERAPVMENLMNRLHSSILTV